MAEPPDQNGHLHVLVGNCGGSSLVWSHSNGARWKTPFGISSGWQRYEGGNRSDLYVNFRILLLFPLLQQGFANTLRQLHFSCVKRLNIRQYTSIQALKMDCSRLVMSQTLQQPWRSRVYLIKSTVCQELIMPLIWAPKSVTMFI